METIKGVITGVLIFVVIILAAALFSIATNKFDKSEFQPYAVAYLCSEMPPSPDEDTLSRFYKCGFELVIEIGDKECRLKKI